MSYILLVEDDDMNRMIIEDMIEFDDLPTEFVSVGSGEEAIQQVRDRIPQLVLMDVGLPGIDGLEATRQIREIPGAESISIWALTAHAMKGDEKRALEAGCNEYIPKPIEYKSFKLKLAKYLESAAAESPTD